MSNVTEQFIERMGLVFQADGMPRIAGRLFGFFVIRGGTQSFSELAEQLQVSRGSISTNARMLESLGMLEKTARPGDRQDYFRLNDDPYGRMLRGYIDRMRKNVEMVQRTLNDLPTDDPGGERLREMRDFYDIALASLGDGLRQWAEQRHRSNATRQAGTS